MAVSTYQQNGFAAFVLNGKAHIIGRVSVGSSYSINSPALVVFNETIDGLRADLISKGYTILN
jgi:hypothetical protein